LLNIVRKKDYCNDNLFNMRSKANNNVSAICFISSFLFEPYDTNLDRFPTGLTNEYGLWIKMSQINIKKKTL